MEGFDEPRWAVEAKRGAAGGALSDASVERTAAIVDRLFARAAVEGERFVLRARAIIGGVGLLVWPAFVWDELVSGMPRAWLTIGVAFVTVMGSLLAHRWLRQRDTSLRMQAISIAIDAALAFGVMVGHARWPGQDYGPSYELPGVGLFYFLVLGAGARLSRRGALLGIVLNGVGLIALFSLDRVWNGGRAADPAAYATVAGLFAAVSTLAVSIATRTRRLLVDTASQTLLATRARARLGTYVSEEVAEASLISDELCLGGTRQQVAVLFSDLRGFTAYSETLPPEELVRQLNAYLDAMVAAIRAEGGVVDKFIGDAVMAVFGAPQAGPDDAARALRAASRMQAALVRHNVDREREGLPPLSQGLGGHYGPVVAGNVGSLERASYTVIGDTVNLASRLESGTKERGVPVLLSGPLVKAAQAYAGDAELPSVRPLGALAVRGREALVEVYTFADVSPRP